MRYTMAQIDPTTGDIPGNTERITDAIATARAADSDIVVFPELAVTGYCIGDLIEEDAFVAANQRAITDIAAYTDDIAAVVGFIDTDEQGNRYNAAAVLQDGGRAGIVHKQLLPNYRYFDDERYFTVGGPQEPVPVQAGGDTVSLGVSICEDMWDQDYESSPITALTEQGADLIVNINASPFAAGKYEERDQIIRDHIDRHRVPFAYVNTVGAADVGNNILVFDGESLAYDADGQLIAYGAVFEEDAVTVDLDTDGPIERTPRSREQELYDGLVAGLSSYAEKTGFDTAIQPVSGGIDSALGLVLTAEAFGSEHVTAYNLPSIVNTDETRDRAELLADNLGVEYVTLPIQEIYDDVCAAFAAARHPVEQQTAQENIYARIRGMLMMLASNEDGGLLVSNGNETEMALGYATLYGDMTGGISLLGDLSKTEVYALSRYANERHEEPVIPTEIIEATPSAELSDGQEDPFDYEIVAPLVSRFLTERDGPQAVMDDFDASALEQFPDKVYGDRDAFERTVQDTYRRFTSAAFKRVQAPPVIAVSERAFGTDLREPIINDWDGGM